MKRTVISISVAFLLAVLIWFVIGILAPSINYEKALIMIVYPSLGAGIITALVWRPRRSRP